MSYHLFTFTGWLAAHGYQGAIDSYYEKYPEHSASDLISALLKQGEFASHYSAWLNHCVTAYADQIGLLFGVDPSIIKVTGINQNDPSGLPTIAGLSQADVDVLFGETGLFAWMTGGKNVVTHERYFSDIFYHSLLEPPANPVITSAIDDVAPAGELASGALTNDGDLLLKGTAQAGSTVTIYSGATLLGTAVADADGNWEFQTGPLGDGEHSFTATASNIFGTSAASAEFSVTLDTAAPEAPLVALQADTGTAGNFITQDGTVTVSGLEPGAIGEYSVNGGAWIAFSGDSFVLVGDDAYSVVVRQTDGAGNVSPASAALAFTLDTAAPAVDNVSITHTSTGNRISTITITFSEEVEFEASMVKLDGVAVKLRSGTTPQQSSDKMSWTIEVDQISAGAQSVTGTLTVSGFTDKAGNLGTIYTQTAVTLHPAGTSGEPIGLGLTDPAETGALVTVTVEDLPEGWVLNGGWSRGEDGGWTIETTDVRSLSVTTPLAFAGAMVLAMAMRWTNADGSVESRAIANNIEAFAPGNPIIAWWGDDHLTGADGSPDTFVIAEPVGHVVIYSFEAQDKVNLIGFAAFDSFADVLANLSEDEDGSAVITLGDGSSVTIRGVGADELGEGNFVFHEVPEMSNAGTIVIGDGAMLPLSGVVNNSGTIEMNSEGAETLLQLIRDGIDLKGGGNILMSDSDGNIIAGTSAEIVLTNVDNTIAGAGHLGYGQMTLINHGTIVATGTHTLDIDTGLNVVVNTGTLKATGKGGLSIQSDVVNDGLIWAYGGDVTIHGTVGGSGTAMIGDAVTVTFGAAASAKVVFAEDAAGTLTLGDSFNFDGLISGFDGNDRLALTDFMFSGDLALGYSANAAGTGGTLSLSNGAQEASVGLLGQYEAGWFQLAEHEGGGTVVTYGSVDPFASA